MRFGFRSKSTFSNVKNRLKDTYLTKTVDNIDARHLWHRQTKSFRHAGSSRSSREVVDDRITPSPLRHLGIWCLSCLFTLLISAAQRQRSAASRARLVLRLRRPQRARLVGCSAC